jgi:hypothetical protein
VALDHGSGAENNVYLANVFSYLIYLYEIDVHLYEVDLSLATLHPLTFPIDIISTVHTVKNTCQDKHQIT